VLLRGTLMGLRRDRSGYVVPRSLVTLLAGLVSFGILPLVMVERGYWRWSRGEQVKLQATARSFGLLDATASPVARVADDFASGRERRLWVYGALGVGMLMSLISLVGIAPGLGPWWTVDGLMWSLAGILLTAPASVVLLARMIRHARGVGRVVSVLDAWQIDRERRPVRVRTRWMPDPLLLVCAIIALALGATWLALPWFVAAMWRGYVLGASLLMRQALADRLEEVAGLTHDPAHATLAPPAA
jgi:hypothetical protein